MSSDERSKPSHSHSEERVSTAANGDLYLAMHAERAREAIVKSYRIIKVPDYFLDQWLPLLGSSRWLAALSFRQLAFIHKCKDKTGKKPTRTTFRELSRWSGQSRPQMHKLLKDPGLLTWFVVSAEGKLGVHPLSRSERRVYLVRIEIPLTPRDQAKLEAFLRAHQPSDDESWLKVLHSALAAKDSKLPENAVLPDHPKTIQQMVRELRGPEQPLSEEIDWACDELLERWQSQNFGQVTHYFIRRWLPDLTPGLGCLVIWSRRHANKQQDDTQIGQLRAGGWKDLANAVGVTAKTASRWLNDKSKYPHTEVFLDPIPVYAGAGTIEAIKPDSLEVAGETIVITGDTLIKDTLHVGDFIKLRAERRNGSLNAISLELASESDFGPGLSQSHLSFDVKLTEPIHPNDRSHYQKLLDDDNVLSFGEQVLQTNVGAGALQDFLPPSESETKVDNRRTLIDNHSPEVPYFNPNVDNHGTEVDNHGKILNFGRPEVDIDQPRVDTEQTEIDALRVSLKPSYRLLPEEYKEQQHTNFEASNKSQSSQQGNVAVVPHNNWDVRKILVQSAIPKRDKQAILDKLSHKWHPFIAWLLWSVATPTIDAPVLHAVSRLKGEEEPPSDFFELAGATPADLSTWLSPSITVYADCPDVSRSALMKLRKNDAYRKLQELGVLPDPAHEDSDSWKRTTTDTSIDGEREEVLSAKDLGACVNEDGMTVESAWNATKGHLQMELPKASYDTWLRDVELQGFVDGDTIVLAVGNSYARDWLQDRISGTTQRVLTGVVGRPMKVKIIVFGDEQ